MTFNRVVVTGYGLTSPIGNTPKDFWNNYENIKNFKPNYKTGRSDIALESKALFSANT